MNMSNSAKQRFHQGFWLKQHNQRIVLDEIAKKLNIISSKDWGKITIKDVLKHKGGSTLLKMHKFSLLRALKYAYDGI